MTDSLKINILLDIDESDPISFLITLDVLCSNINTTTQRNLSNAFAHNKMRNNETASRFLTRMNRLYRKARIYSIREPDSLKIEILLTAIGGVPDYKHLHANWEQRPQEEVQYPQYFVGRWLTYHDIVTTLRNHDNNNQIRQTP
jgi:hypothetical protein